MATTPDKQLDILHDHYKDTFARIRESEAQRDRLFLWVIGLFALLSVEIGYPAAVGGSLGKLTILGGELNLQALPLSALLHVTWVLTLTISLRYCQIAVFINRQYPYLHALEEVISPLIGGGTLYRREGKVYLEEYPPLLDVAWLAYSILFPLITLGATIGLATWEYLWLPYPPLHILFDILIAVTLGVFLFLYRVYPGLTGSWKRFPAFLSRTKPPATDTQTIQDNSGSDQA